MFDPRRIVRILSAVALAITAGAAQAGSPAMVTRDSTSDVRAEASFAAFTKGFIERARERSVAERSSPRAQRASDSFAFSYRAVGDEFETELQPTGRPSAPFVGVLRYTEHTMLCEDAGGRSCRVGSSLPVTEIFRLREGRWTY